MKLLDPFAGYRLACGHPIFHACLFICSFITEFYGIEHRTDSPAIWDAFWNLRWMHCLLFFLTSLAILMKRDSDLPLDYSMGADKKYDSLSAE